MRFRPNPQAPTRSRCPSPELPTHTTLPVPLAFAELPVLPVPGGLYNLTKLHPDLEGDGSD